MELELKQLGKVSGGKKAAFGGDPEPVTPPYQPYEIEEAPDDIGLPNF